jgi:hypothetical protein
MNRYVLRKKKPSVPTEGRRTLEDMNLGELELLLDAEISIHVRGAPALKSRGFIACYTCGGMHHYTEMDAGHYIGRAHRGTRWDLRNIRPQCTKCNSYEEGRHWQFRRNLVAEIGAEEVENLEQLAEMYGASRFDKDWIVQQIRTWREKNKALRKELKCLSK